MIQLYRLCSVLTAGLLLFSSAPAAAISERDKALLFPFYSAASSCRATISANGSVDRFLQALAAQESSGNPTAEAAGSSASGKYQYLIGTWAGVSKKYYPPAQQFREAKDAPEAVQDAVAYLEYTDKFKSLDNDLFKLALSHFYPLALTKPDELDKIIGSNSITPRQYAEKFVKGVNEGAGKDIPLLYAQAPDFQTWLAKVGGSAGISSASNENSCQGGIPAGDFVLYSQYDPKWAQLPFGTSTIAESGCGPSALAMIVATFKDKSITPKEVAAYGTSIGGFVPNTGSDWNKMFIQAPTHYGLKSTDIGTDMNKAIEYIKAGGLVIASGEGPAPFTQNGHIIVLRGVTADGKILIGDSGHRETNDQEHDPAKLGVYIKNMWGVTK